ncbi:C1 family peptidase [Nonomuraea aurantiaca]|uniref:C1 family peptidase n=1 Tax=Nonomuraea aurantiaca TaxID=2878562 RepID=UPI001CDA53D5|nr:C1 family peptidase [Nonomuraea aurantiaca]MCA2227196.1 C1 family peptidase [Nonomuraea aurantiaca]
MTGWQIAVKDGFLTTGTDLAPPWSARGPTGTGLPPATDSIERWFPAVIDQGEQPLCTSAVITAMASYYARRAEGREFEPSLLFNYRLSRKLGGNPDRNGSHILFSLAAWTRYGLADEASWPLDLNRVNDDPPEEAYPASAPRLQLRRLAGDAMPPEKLLTSLKTPLAVGVPVVFEVTLHLSTTGSFADGIFPVPHPREALLGTHVVLLVGYDENQPCGPGLTGAFRVLNSWGTRWGDDGYGWLPFAYVRQGPVRDSWLAIEPGWAATRDRGPADDRVPAPSREDSPVVGGSRSVIAQRGGPTPAR